MITIFPRAAAALHAPSHTDEQRLAISDLIQRWADEGQVQQVTKALIQPHGRVLIFCSGYMRTDRRFDVCVGVDRNGSVWAL